MAGSIAVIFDLDGTLIDSAPDLRAALNRVLASRGLPPLTANAVQAMIGDGAKALVERAWAAHGKLAEAADLADFLADYEANSAVETLVYPGMLETLKQLTAGGHRLAICTNKPVAASRIILEALGLQDFFPVLVGGDSTPYRKPDPRHLQAAVAALGGSAAVAARGRSAAVAARGGSAAVMIGDHENDMAAARGLGLPSIFVGWGYGDAVGTYRADSATDLPGIIAGLQG